LSEELASARAGDGAEVGNRLVTAHADAVVDDPDRARVAVELDADRELGIVLEQAGRIERLEAQLVAGVGCIGNQLAQEYLAITVQRVDHQLQQLPHLGLETEGLLLGRARLPVRLRNITHRLEYLESIRMANNGRSASHTRWPGSAGATHGFQGSRPRAGLSARAGNAHRPGPARRPRSCRATRPGADPCRSTGPGR